MPVVPYFSDNPADPIPPELADDLHTVRDWLRFAASAMSEAGERGELFLGHGCDNVWDEAAWLVLHTIHQPLVRLEAILDARLTRGERERLLGRLHRRIVGRVPTAYLTHEAWLGEHVFYVDERVIVPRSFIAELLEDHFSPWIDDPTAVGSVLDLCTGSGCLAILAAMTFPAATVDAVDLSADALAVAQRNVADYGLEEVVRLHQGDLWAPVAGQTFDLILSNPPYVDAPSMATLPAEYRQEPALALAGGDDGLDLVHRLLREAPRHLNPGGHLVVEIGHNREVLEASCPTLPFVWLDTEAGGDFVFLVSREDLVDWMA